MRQRTSRPAAAGLLALLLLPLGAAPASASDPNGADVVKPHRALYEIALVGASDLFESARGLAATEIRRTCDGWRFSQRFELETTQVAGETSRAVLLIDATEAADGGRYAFHSSNDYGDGAPFVLVGQAVLDKDGGTARYTEPAPVEMALPADTGFAISSVRQAIRAAMDGAKQHRAHWFAGSTPDEPILVNSIIAPAEAPADADGLLSGERWRFLSAFFSRTNDGAPLYEGEETLIETGVLADAVYRYDGYTLHLRLARVEPLPEPDC